MTISGLGTSYAYLQSTGVSSTAAARRTAETTVVGAAPDPSSRVPGPIAAAAEVLGLSVDEVTKALSAGSSLADLAEQQGISREKLVAALVADAPDEIQATGDVTAMVQGLVDRVGMGGPGGGPPPSGSSGVLGAELTSAQQKTVDALSDLLHTDSASLLEKLRNGTSLSDLLSADKVTTKDLAGLIENGLLIDTSA
jgi:hypothetical protein